MPEVKLIVALPDAVCVDRRFSAPPKPETELSVPDPLLTHKVFPPASLTVLTFTSGATMVSPESPTVSVLPDGAIVLTLIVVTRLPSFVQTLQ